jgi:hypothetical protein
MPFIGGVNEVNTGNHNLVAQAGKKREQRRDNLRTGKSEQVFR